jgi:nucleoprotein TPR
MSRVEFSVQTQTTSTLNISRGSSLIFSFETPSPDAVLSLYRFVVSQAVDLDGSLRDLEVSRAEVERKEIELDQALQDRESSYPFFKHRSSRFKRKSRK